ncbi:hypothetical protein CEXT_104261 [Caerostris extrusa]|uniref:Uncharacterized protein n=1 Tax=Caerostris extrusa TaxID=172846 RepID=A0AAV4SIC1_CAEEX|nr:hypothetical protein CEXT_104261 [Caerostris extrusa]
MGSDSARSDAHQPNDPKGGGGFCYYFQNDVLVAAPTTSRHPQNPSESPSPLMHCCQTDQKRINQKKANSISYLSLKHHFGTLCV